MKHSLFIEVSALFYICFKIYYSTHHNLAYLLSTIIILVVI